MRLMIDTNVLLDVLVKREPFYEASREVLRLCEEKKVQGFLSASAATDIFYLVRRHLHSTNSAYKCLGYVLDILKVLTVTNEDVINAYTKKAHDFEDCLLAVCAASNKCDYIITRNKRAFEEFNIKTLSPEELLSRF